MRREYSTRVKIAGVNVLFKSDMEIDICNLCILFKHHLTDDSPHDKEYHYVEIKTVNKMAIPKDAKLVWEGVYHGVGQKGKPNNDVKKYLSTNGQFEYFVSADEACIVNDLTSGRTTCALLIKCPLFHMKQVRPSIGSVIILLTHIVMSYHRRYTLHASAVVWRGKALVFTGKSGQGKSTLCTDLVALGAGFLGDDIVFAYLKEGKPYIASLLFDAKLYESSRKYKDFIDIIDRYHCEKIDNVPLQAIVGIHQTRQGKSAIEKSNDPDQLLSVFLTAANNIALQYDHDDWMTLCACIMENFRLYTFHFGDRTLLKKDILNEFYEQG